MSSLADLLANATARPWERRSPGAIHCACEGALLEGHAILDANPLRTVVQPYQAEATLELAAHAVNHLEPLIEALEGVADIAAVLMDTSKAFGKAELNNARAVLRAAKGESE